MFPRLSFAQAMGQLLAVAIDCVVGLFTPRRRPTDVRTNAPSQVISPQHDDGRSTALVQSPETPPEQHSVA
ncbi:MAG: hypothetical protein IIA66_07090 [Planctomycetes bacterium]|nr:hypothetical protein [Planctomycetota bacterium]